MMTKKKPKILFRKGKGLMPSRPHDVKKNNAKRDRKRKDWQDDSVSD